MPFLLSKAEATGSGLVIEGSELLDDSKMAEWKLVQVEIEDMFHENRNGLIFSYSMTMNPNRIISVLIGNVVFIRHVADSVYELSTISVAEDDELIHYDFQMKERREKE